MNTNVMSTIRTATFILATLFISSIVLAGDNSSNPAPKGPGSGEVGSMGPGIAPPSGGLDMGNGEFVDNLSGNLVVTHPVAIPLKCNGQQNISLARVYQSKSAESKPTDIDNFHQYPYSWVGYRWSLHMGRITIHGKGDQTYYVYEGPGGDEHRLYQGPYIVNDPGDDEDLTQWYFTADGSYIRAWSTGSAWYVHFPNGAMQALTHDVAPIRDEDDRLLNADEAGWYAAYNYDPYANSVKIEYWTEDDLIAADVGYSDGDKFFKGSIRKITDTKSAGDSRYIEFLMSKNNGGPEGVFLLNEVVWQGIGGAARRETYRYTTVGDESNTFFYPHFTDKTEVPVLVSVTRYPDSSSGGATVAYDYAYWDEMHQVDPGAVGCGGDGEPPCDGDWDQLRGLRLSDIYYPSGLRSHYEYHQDQYLSSLDYLPHPPPGTLNPDTDNWVYHAGVGVTERWAVFVTPDPLFPDKLVSFNTLKTYEESDLEITVLKWTWNRYGIRNLPATNVDPRPHVVTADPLGREVAHYYGYYDLPGAGTDNYPSVSPLETRTKIYSTHFDYKTPGTKASLAKRIDYRYEWAGEDNGAYEVESGDVKYCTYQNKDGVAIPVELGNPHIRQTIMDMPPDFSEDSSTDDADIIITSLGWDGYGHQERTAIRGRGIFSGNSTARGIADAGHYVSFQKYYLHVDDFSHGTKEGYYIVSQPQLAGSLLPGLDEDVQGRLSLTYHKYTTKNPPAQVTYINTYLNANEGNSPLFTATGRINENAIYYTWHSCQDNDTRVQYYFSDSGAGALSRVAYYGENVNLYDYKKEYSYFENYGVPRRFRWSHMSGAQYVWQREYDDFTGQLITEMDENGFTTTMAYDDKDRLVEVQVPNAYPARTYHKSLGTDTLTLGICDQAIEIDFPSRVLRSGSYTGPYNYSGFDDPMASISANAQTVGAESYADALGRTWLSRSVAADDDIECTMSVYGLDGKVVYSSQPYVENALTTISLDIDHVYRQPFGAATANPTREPCTLTVQIPETCVPELSDGLVKDILGTYTSVYLDAEVGDPFKSFDTDWRIDPLGRVRKVFPPVGDPITYTYSEDSFAKTVTVSGIQTGLLEGDTSSSSTTYLTNALGRLIMVDAPEGGADAIYDYDVNGNLRASRLVDSLGTYLLPPDPDPDPEPEALLTQYETSGINMLSGGQVRNFTYDSLGRLRSVNNPAVDPHPIVGSEGVTLEQGYEEYESYDALGNLLAWTDAKGIAEGYYFEASYDERGRKTQIKQSFLDGTASRVLVENQYDDYLGITLDWQTFPYSQYPGYSNHPFGKLTRTVNHNYREREIGGVTFTTDETVNKIFSYSAPGGRLSDEMMVISWFIDPGDTIPPDFEPDADDYRDLYYEHNIQYTIGSATGVGHGLIDKERFPDDQYHRTFYSHGVPIRRRDKDSVVVDDITYLTGGRFASMDLNYETRPVGHILAGYDGASRLLNLSLLPQGLIGGDPEAWKSGNCLYDGAGNIREISRGAMGSDLFMYDQLGRLKRAAVQRQLRLADDATLGYIPTLDHIFSYDYDEFGNLLKRNQHTSWNQTHQESYDSLVTYLAQVASHSPYNNHVEAGKHLEFIGKATTDSVIHHETSEDTSMSTNRLAEVRHGYLGEAWYSEVDYQGQYDPSGRVLSDMNGQYEYDALGRQISTRDESGITLEEMLYDSGGSRVAVVADGKATTYMRSGGEVVWQISEDVASKDQRRKSFLRAAGRLVAEVGDVVETVYGSDWPGLQPALQGDIQEMASVGKNIDPEDICVPELSDPLWSEANPSHSDLTYEVHNLCDDVAWIEVRKSRLKLTGNPPCNGSSCEDDVEIIHLDRPEGGWGVPIVSFEFLKGDKIYQVLFRFGSEAAGHPALGAMIFSGAGDVLACPKKKSKLKQRLRVLNRLEGVFPIPQLRFSADAPLGFDLIGNTTEGVRYLATSATGEDLFIDQDDENLNGVLDFAFQPFDGSEDGALPILDPHDSRPNRRREVRFFATDHLGTTRASYIAHASYPAGSTFPDNAWIELESTHDYSPFGLELFPVDNSDNTLKYTGHERDETTGNDYMHSRFYGNNIGRFLKPDNIITSITNPQGWNRYNYVLGNPVNLIDPWGHYPSMRSQRYKFQGGRFAYGAVGWKTMQFTYRINGDQLILVDVSDIAHQGFDQSAPNAGQMVAAGNVWSDTGSALQLSAAYPYETTMNVVGEPYSPMERSLDFFGTPDDGESAGLRAMGELIKLWGAISSEGLAKFHFSYLVPQGYSCGQSTGLIADIAVNEVGLEYWDVERWYVNVPLTGITLHQTIVLQPVAGNPLPATIIDAYIYPMMIPYDLRAPMWRDMEYFETY